MSTRQLLLLLLWLLITSALLFQVAHCRRERHRQTVFINYKDPDSESEMYAQEDESPISEWDNNHNHNKRQHHHYSTESKKSYRSDHQTKRSPKHVKKQRLTCRLIRNYSPNSEHKSITYSSHGGIEKKKSRSCSCHRSKNPSRTEENSHSVSDYLSASQDDVSVKTPRKKYKYLSSPASDSVKDLNKRNSLSISIKLKHESLSKNTASSCDKSKQVNRKQHSESYSDSTEEKSDIRSSNIRTSCSSSIKDPDTISCSNSAQYSSSISHKTKSKEKCQEACAKSLKHTEKLYNLSSKTKSSDNCCASHSEKKSINEHSNSCSSKSVQSSAISKKSKHYISSSSEKGTDYSRSSKSCYCGCEKHKKIHEHSSGSSTDSEFTPPTINPSFWPFPFPPRSYTGDNKRFGEEFFDYNPFMRMPYVIGILSKHRPHKSHNGMSNLLNLGASICHKKCKT